MKRNLILLFVFAMCVAEAFAAPRTFVSVSAGNDVNPCSLTSPCRSFASAVLVTDLGGEVIALDSGGYGVVTLTQSISLIAPEGVFAGLTVTSLPPNFMDQAA